MEGKGKERERETRKVMKRNEMSEEEGRIEDLINKEN